MNKTIADSTGRPALFISHANPEDNDFVRWLAAKLSALGYEVWADVLRLLGGDDWSRKLEEALRHRACKLLLVCTRDGVNKEGVRNEIEIGTQVARGIRDNNFIIPLRLGEFEAPFRIATRQYVDFKNSWASGLRELLELLQEYKIPKQGHSLRDWTAIQALGAPRVEKEPESLISNWVALRRLPPTINFCSPPSGFPLETFVQRNRHVWPVAPFGDGVLTFACPDIAGNIAPGVPAVCRSSLRLRKFLNEGWHEFGIEPYEARRQFSDLANTAFDLFFAARGLSCYETSGGRRWWFGALPSTPKGMVRFSWAAQRGLRQIIGHSGKRGIHWHYAISTRVRTGPVRHVKLAARLVFSDNGSDVIPDPLKMNRLRRSFAKGWRNARWRDMQGAFLWWIANGERSISLPVGHSTELVVALPPLQFVSPVSVKHGADIEDEDDPDVEFDEPEEMSRDEEGEEIAP